MSEPEFRQGDKVSVQFTGEVRAVAGQGLTVAVARPGKLPAIKSHVIFPGDPYVVALVKRPEVYVLGQAYKSKNGLVLLRARSKKMPHLLGWRSYSGTFYGESLVSKPMTRLVPEGGK